MIWCIVLLEACLLLSGLFMLLATSHKRSLLLQFNALLPPNRLHIRVISGNKKSNFSVIVPQNKRPSVGKSDARSGPLFRREMGKFACGHLVAENGPLQ